MLSSIDLRYSVAWAGAKGRDDPSVEPKELRHVWSNLDQLGRCAQADSNLNKKQLLTADSNKGGSKSMDMLIRQRPSALSAFQVSQNNQPVGTQGKKSCCVEGAGCGWIHPPLKTQLHFGKASLTKQAHRLSDRHSEREGLHF